MTINLKFLDPLSVPDWDSEITAYPEANVFHTAAWARTLVESYGYVPHYAVWYEGEKSVAVVPLMEVKSFLTGTRGVSLPFTDLCPLLSSGMVSVPVITEELEVFGTARGWKALETRGLTPVQEGADVPGEGVAGEADNSPAYYVHELDLTGGEESLLSQVRSSTRRNIRKSIKQDVRIVEDSSSKGLREFVRLNLLTRREHGLPPQPVSFFERLLENVIEPGMGRIMHAIHDGRYVSSMILLHFNGHAIYKYGASDKKYGALRANNLLMWEAIKSYADQGERSFHFGRTEPENSGLLQFKRGWGCVEGLLEYRKYDYQSSKWLPNPASVSGFHTHLFSRMPLFALSFIGKVLYRHMG